ncbi:FCD domain-containing protein [Hoeflea sp. YIM 152468]|uniref:FadR/GntR family transcriptional regulator n=1 Tax=Hoeflea sp. YIM 152468 TaxID=3031759 RepID=UPI0023DB635D|nr:FCD domain-containing protein [Hoeflea sp. YIM 152468]MDF1610195.1 FCD domain-containing protein [Hoeflea sp. YIM 152468]
MATEKQTAGSVPGSDAAESVAENQDAAIRPPSRSAVDEMVQSIRGLISSEGLTVGDNLPTERELCERFEASRNTVREAMRILKAYGIVSVRPKVGATIIDDRMERALDLFSFNTLEVSRDTFVDVQGFRGLLEVASVDVLFEKIVAADIADLHAANEDLRHAKAELDASEADFRFHTRLVQIMDNKAVLDVYKIMKPVILRIMLRGKTRHTFSTSTFSEHGDILEALEARDRTAYQYKMKTHLENGFRHFSA